MLCCWFFCLRFQNISEKSIDEHQAVIWDLWTENTRCDRKSCANQKNNHWEMGYESPGVAGHPPGQSPGHQISWLVIVSCLQLPQVSQWLASLPASLLHSLMMTSLSLLSSARDRDSLLLLLTSCLSLGLQSCILPASLVMDESSRWAIQSNNPGFIFIPVNSPRLYLLSVLQKQDVCSRLRSFICECYNMNMVR